VDERVDHGLSLAWKSLVQIYDGFFALLPNMLIGAVVFFIFYQISKVCNRLIFAVANKARMDRTLAGALARLSAVAVNVLGALVCAMILIPSFSPDKLIAGLGVTSVAIGFAFQNILQNFFAGMLLLWQKPFGIGDEIKVKDYEGVVEDITIRTTLLRTASSQRVYVPNGVLFTEAVTVNTAFSKRRVHIQMPIPEKIGTQDAREIAAKALNQLEIVSKDPKPSIFTAAASGALSLDIYFWAKSRDHELTEATDEASSAIHHALIDKKLELEKSAQAKAASLSGSTNGNGKAAATATV
jgi:small conductance mechanosensitive channel